MTSQWQPTATIHTLQKRAQIIAQIRQFFAARCVLEVETPTLAHATVTDVHLHSLNCNCHNFGKLYLQTSPEYAMKRLLAAGSGSIYQICKSFRDDEHGRYHNPEFTMLEWYRLSFSQHDLMAEMEELLQLILNCAQATRYSYRKLFTKYLDFNPHVASVTQLQIAAQSCGIKAIAGVDAEDRDVWLQLLLSEVIEPQLRRLGVVFVYDYPETQAALAKLKDEGDYKVAERFEVYVDGIELANGFCELTDAREQRARFMANLEKRRKFNLPQIPLDEQFLAALESGLPTCSGVALGLDRLIMLALGAQNIAQVMSFAF